MKVIKVLDTVVFNTCLVRREIVDGFGTPTEWKAAYSLIDGSYIGDCEQAQMLESRGIVPQRRRPDHKTASIGHAPKENKWYGWSHRAIYGFGIGTKVVRGSCAYKPVDKNDLMTAHIRFWADEESEQCTQTIITDKSFDVISPYNDEPGLGLSISTECVRKADNELLQSTHWAPYPDVWGRGEWTARTIEDAKIMASDFSDGVS